MKKRSEELKSFIKSNKLRREIMALKAGFKSADSYRRHLEGNEFNYHEYRKLSKKEQLEIARQEGYQTIAGYMSFLRAKQQDNTNTKTVSQTKPVEKKVMYNIFVLDESGSMSGSKYNNAKMGIVEEIGLLRKEKNLDIKLGIVPFDNIVSPLVIESLNHYTIKIPRWGTTALNDAIGITLTSLMRIIKPGEKAVLKIFTDGGENASREFSIQDARHIIQKAEKQGITVVFIGTEQDTRRAIKNYSLRSDNTLVHNNTGEGVKEAFKTMAASTVAYTKSYSSGASDEELLDGFFKRKGEL